MLLGRFCANCSQAADVHVPTTMELMHELLEGITHSDSRLWRTLTTLWFKPGKLTEEFVAGRRVAYLPPFRLYLILSIMFFLLASFVHTHVAVMNFDEALKPGGRAASASAAAGKSHHQLQRLQFHRLSQLTRPGTRGSSTPARRCVRDNGEQPGCTWPLGTLSKAMFIFLPLIAFLHMLLYWRPRYRYAEHLLFFVHLHAFYFSVAIVMFCLSDAADAWPKLEGVGGHSGDAAGLVLAGLHRLGVCAGCSAAAGPAPCSRGLCFSSSTSIVFGLTVAGVFVYAALQL